MSIKKIVFVLCWLVGVAAQAQNDTVLFSAQGGFYEDVFSLEMFNYYPQYHIRYTVNGNRPTAQSPLYDEPLMLDERIYSKSDIFTIVNCLSNEFFAVDSREYRILIHAVRRRSLAKRTVAPSRRSKRWNRILSFGRRALHGAGGGMVFCQHLRA